MFKRTGVKAVAAAILVLFAASLFAGALGKHETRLFSFESGTTEGWHGANKLAKAVSVATMPEATDGTKMLKVDLTGVNNWNQDAMIFDGPFTADWAKLQSISVDVFLPEASTAGMTYHELYLVISGKANAWYQLKKPLNKGMNNLTFKIDNAKVQGQLWHVYFVVNTSEPWKGPIYLDNIVGKLKGEPGTVTGKVVDSVNGSGVANTLVVLGDQLGKTDGSGKFTMTVPEDSYKAEFAIYGYVKKTVEGIEVLANKTKDMGEVAIVKQKEPKKDPVTVTIDASRVTRTIDPHKLYGNNIAAWHPVTGYRDNVAIEKLKKLNLTYYRMPGGDYGNQYDWKTGDVYSYDGNVSWTPELNYFGGMVPFIKRMEKEMGNVEVLPIINILSPAKRTIQQRIDYGIEWLLDMRNKGLKFNYVEIGNEMDNKPQVPGPSSQKDIFNSPTDLKNLQWWTLVDNYSKVFNKASYDIKTKVDKNLKIMGPIPMQPMNQERKEGEPWKADKNAPYWVEKFLSKSWQYVDVLTVHEYPLWANNNAVALLKKPQETWPSYMPKYKEWIKKYVNSKKGYENKKIEIALTEWNSGDENSMTATIDNALFCADYLGSFIKQGGDIALMWDLYTQKPGLGGGHGVIDAENDQTSKFSERSHYWVMMLYGKYFNGKMLTTNSSSPNLSVYSAINKDNKLVIVGINKTKLSSAEATFAIDGTGVGSGKAYQLSDKEFVWSKDLYRPIVNSGPSEINVNGGTNFKYSFPPYSIPVIELIR